MKPIYKCTKCGAYTEQPVHCNAPAQLVLDGKHRLMLSKLVSYLLRHDPEAAGLHMDSEGWVDVNQLVHGIKTKWPRNHLYQWVTPEHVKALALLDPKGRFELKEGKIRARYGHNQSLNVNIDYPEDVESAILYHGTTLQALPSILREGLKPLKRKYVHLTTNIQDAIETAKRHRGRPVVLEIDCEKLRSMGIKIYKASPTIRLAKHVPPSCIKNIIQP